MKRTYLLLFIQIFFLSFSGGVKGGTLKTLGHPLMIGPQYPLLFLSTTFEPDTAFLTREGEIFLQASFSSMNTYGMSENSDKSGNPDGSSERFNPSNASGYSVYIDGEFARRFLRVHYGYSDYLEVQLTYRQIKMFPGGMDSTVENFHHFFNLKNQGRENTDQDQLEIYIHDNETNTTIYKITKPSDTFSQESITLGFKFYVRETDQEAISISVASNFGDHHLETEINEATSDLERTPHRNFNDYNASLQYTSLFPDWTLHAAYSVSFVGKSLLAKSPKELSYFFLGAIFHLSDSLDLMIQNLDYTSPFPEDNTSAISADIREITAGIRLFFGENAAFEIGFTENQTQGPQNIDIAFFSNLMFQL